MKYRNEWKYICTDGQLNVITAKLCRVLKLDEHSQGNRYTVHSLYFDDFQNSCIKDNEAGVERRSKWRIRYYNDDLNYISLEKKEKLYGRCRKKSALISKEIAEKIINNEIQEVLWSSDNELLKQFCIESLTRLYRPKTIVDYERQAFVEPISNVRITFDMDISGSYEVKEFLSGNYLKVPLQPKGEQVLEVKFDDILPSYIQQAAYLDSLEQTSFSKYYLSRTLTGGIKYDELV